jgi:hypothetical protein
MRYAESAQRQQSSLFYPSFRRQSRPKSAPLASSGPLTPGAYTGSFGPICEHSPEDSDLERTLSICPAFHCRAVPYARKLEALPVDVFYRQAGRREKPPPWRDGSVTAGQDAGGVRPSSGAAMLESDGDVMKAGASADSVLAAPEDGRTPLTSPPPSLTHYDLAGLFLTTGQAPQERTSRP